MRKEDIVVSFELAKKLKEAGVNSPSLFYWRVWSDGSVDLAMEHDDFDYSGAGRTVVEKIPAYTAVELMEKLPDCIRVGKDRSFYLVVYKLSNSYKVDYECMFFDEIETLCEFEGRKVSDALAQALIWWKKKEGGSKMNKEKSDKIPVLNPNYNLSADSDLELAQTMKRLCGEYEMCYYTISTAICEIWDGIVRVAEEIVRRGSCQRYSEKREVKKND